MATLAVSAIVALLKLIRENYRRIGVFNQRADTFVQYLDVVEKILADFDAEAEAMDALLRNTLESLHKVIRNAHQVFLQILHAKESFIEAKRRPLRKKLARRVSSVMRKVETFMYPKESIDEIDFQRREIESYVQLLQLNVAKSISKSRNPNADNDHTQSCIIDQDAKENGFDSDSGSSSSASSVDMHYMLSLAVRKHGEFLPNTRQWVFDAILRFAHSQDHQVFLLVAAAGLGKSVLLAELCARGGALDKLLPASRPGKGIKEMNFVVGAAHFFVYRHNVFADAVAAVESISWQLSQSIPGFVPARVRTGSGASDGSDLHTLFYDSVLAPLSRFNVSPFGKPLLIVLDALDECGVGQRDAFVRVIMTCMQGDLQLPSWVKMVVSTRPQKAQKDLERLFEDVETYVLQPDSELNMKDIEVFFEAALEGRVEGSDEAKHEVSVELARRSEGLFLYAKLVERSTKRLERITMQTLEDEKLFPKGIHRYYRSYFTRVLEHADFAASFREERERIFRAVFAPLFFALEGISPEVLQGTTGYTDRAAFDREVLFVIDELILRKPNGTMVLLHRSLGDFLHEETEESGHYLPTISFKLGNSLLADWCLAHRDQAYSQRNVLNHLHAMGRTEDSDRLLLDADWLCSVVDAVGIYKLSKDARAVAQQEKAKQVAQALSLSRYAIKAYPHQMGVQMWSRLPVHHPLSSAFHKKMLEQQAILPVRFRSYLTSVESAVIHLLRAHDAPVVASSCSPNGQYIASCSLDKSVIVWSVDNGAKLLALRGHNESVWCCAFSPDSELLASGSKDTTIKVWKLPDGELLTTLHGHSSGVEVVRFAPTEAVLVSMGATTEGTVRVWSTSDDFSQLFAFNGTTFAFVPTMNAMILGAEAHVSFISLANGLPKQDAEPPCAGNDEDCIVATAVSADGSRFACATNEAVQLWQAGETADEVIVLDWARMKAVEWSPNGQFAAAWSLTNVRMWDWELGVEAEAWDESYGRCTAFSFSQDSESFALGFFDGRILLCATSTGEVNIELPGHLLCVTSVGFTDSGALVSGSRDNNLRIWKLNEQMQSVVKGHRDMINSVVLSPNGDLVASCAADSTIKLWSTSAGTETAEFIHDRVENVKFSPDGGLLVSFAGYGSDVRIWNLKSMELGRTLKGYQSVDISPDSTMLATYVWEGYKGKVDLWDVEEAKRIRQFNAHNNGYCIRFSPDGRLLASCAMNMRDPMAYNDETVMIWDVAIGEIKHVLSVKAKSIQFSRDGTLFATYQFRSGVTVWSARSGRQLHFLKNHGESFGFSVDSSLLVTTNGAEIKQVVVYDIRNGMKEIERCRHSSDVGQTLLKLHVKNLDGSYPWKGYHRKGTIYVDKENTTASALTFDVGLHEPPSVQSVVKARDFGHRTIIYGALKNNDVFILEYTTRRRNIKDELTSNSSLSSGPNGM